MKSNEDIYQLIADINPAEIQEQIKNKTFMEWCNTWRYNAHEALKILKKNLQQEKEHDGILHRNSSEST